MSMTTNNPDILRVVTQGRMLQAPKIEVKASAKLVVTKAFNMPTDTIEIDTISGTGRSLEKRETALLNITFADGKIWSGDFRALQRELRAYGLLKAIIEGTINYDDTTKEMTAATELIRGEGSK